MNQAPIENRAALIAHLDHGGRAKYLFFWGHEPSRKGNIDQSCLSQWYPASFEVEGLRYLTAEHYMMAEKARLFGDELTMHAILDCHHPGAAKRLGRSVTGFDQAVWHKNRLDIVIRGNLAKFRENAELASFLEKTGQRVLVEASPVDKIWGTGFAGDHENSGHPHLWPGLNLLGFALMAVRHQLRAGADVRSGEK